ncbi:MAG: hypothetical protein H6726_17805 [Sandaracinaceae bacterium]|nr:hypothetical protein [Myxococcales bacterium]MCB9659505.1 hypothetical protein [Sandaracinaceae bacterium]
MVYGTRGVVVGLLLTLAAGSGCGGGSGNNGGRDGGSSTSDLGRRDGGGVCQPTPVTTAAVNASPPGPSTSPGELFDGRCGAAVGQLFPPSAPWNQSVRDTCVDPGSDAIIRYLDAVVDGGQTFRIDLGNSDDNYGFNPLAANASTDTYSFTPTDDFYDTHCDPVPIPVPSTGRLEGEPDYVCNDDGDCHLTVLQTASCQLYEMWRANDVLGTFEGGCLAVWDASTVASDLRGLSCTSADAAGLPITPLLVTPLQVRAGAIRHALRFILPNEAVQRHVYVRPATHNPLTVARHGQPTSGPNGTTPPPYGVRLRLRPDFDTSGLSPGARAMAEALMEYGMIHADGGNVTFIASNDTFSGASWEDADIALGPDDLRDAGLAWTDFEVVSDLSDTVSMQDVECARTPLD